jgi:prevent-host-death family protein
MTRKAKIPPPPGHWRLQDAKARFSDLVRRARSEGPQRVSVHGRDEVVILAAEDFRRLQGEPMGNVLIEAMQSCPYPDIDLEPPREHAPVREVDL